MKLGIFIVVAMHLAIASAAFASPSLVDQASARSRAGDHARAVELYRQAYEQDSNPALLVRMAHEHRLAGDAKQALAYFCSYLYVDAAGELADEASTNARGLAAKLGNPTQSDHDACATKPRTASKPVAQVASTTLDADDVILRKPPRITKREIVGLSLLGGTLVSLGFALYEGGKVQDLTDEITANAAGTDLEELADRKATAQLRQKLLLGASGVTLLTGGVLYVLGRADRKRQERAYVAPSLTRSGGGLVLGGKF